MASAIQRITEQKARTIKVDVKDKKILEMLCRDARMPLTQMAKQVQLSRDAINYRINRLEKLGVIQAFIPKINIQKLGYVSFHILLLLDETKREKQEELIKYLQQHTQVKSIMEYTGRWDYEVVIFTKNLIEFDDFVTDLTSKFYDIILEKRVIQHIKTYFSSYLPSHIDIEQLKNPTQITETVTLDEADKKILGLLSKDCRVSTYTMSTDVQLSPDAISYRIKKLVENEVIGAFTVLVNLTLLNYQLHTYCVQMKTLTKDVEAKLKEFVRNHPNILKAIKTMGPWNLILYIVSDNPETFHRVVHEIKREFAQYIQTYTSWVAYKEHHFTNIPEVLLR